MRPLTVLTILLGILCPNLLLAQQGFHPAQFCADCHREIFDAWSQSRHGQSTVQKDPLFAAMYRWAVRDSRGKLKEKCIACHSPMSTVFDRSEPETPYNRDGVTCQFCHGAREITDFHSAEGIRIDLQTIFSDRPAPENEAHRNKHRDFFANGELCLPCHAEMKTPRDIQVCATGKEWETYHQTTGKTCLDCHMPSQNGIASHLFPGSFLGDLLKKAVDLRLKYSPKTGKLDITLTNRGAGHAVPTGTPLRMVILKVVALDSSGHVVWENWKENPLREDTAAVFMKILGDAQGNGPVPPWQATQILMDRKLMPGVPVKIRYTLPGENVRKIRAVLMYRFAPLPLLKKLNITDPAFTKPRIMVTKSLVLK